MYYGYFDGSASPNPGKIGCGFCIYKDGREILCGASPSGVGTNNEAEYLALVNLLEQCVNHGVDEITCFGDSKLVINQVNGVWNVGSGKLALLAARVRNLSSKIDNISFKWIPREKNVRADMLSKRGVELKELGIKLKGVFEKDNNVTQIRRIRRNSIVMPLANSEFVILENNKPVYINSAKSTCSCASFTKNHRCRHIDALKVVIQGKAV